jgi:hypothetical protein
LWKIVIDRMVFGYLAEYNHQTELWAIFVDF